MSTVKMQMNDGVFTATTYKPWREVDFKNIRFEQRNVNGKWRIDVAKPTLRCITPPGRSNWPKLGKDADIGTQFGPPPEERHKGKYQVDVTDIPAFDGTNTIEYEQFAKELAKADDALLDFMCQNQARYLKRTGLGRDNVMMLQNRSIKTKYDEDNQLTHRSFVLRTPLMQFNPAGALVETPMSICNCRGQVVNTEVHPGDIVAVLAYLRGVYVLGDKFGLQWGFEAVSLIARAPPPPPATEFKAFEAQPAYPYAQEIISEPTAPMDESRQFDNFDYIA